MPVKVSIVVPVYNPGIDIEPGFASFQAQTMPQDEFEIVYVDDGSTDATPRWLKRIEAEHANVRLLTIPNSGWPGRPRNIGIGAARGEYVQFVDQDDRLAPDALRRMYEMGRRNGSDVVMGKVASNFRPNHHSVYRVDRESCTVDDAPLYGSLTPHKMFRTAFLNEHGLRFPEGKWLREDQLFVSQVFLADPKVSILASYVCYYYWKRTTGINNADSGHTEGESIRNLTKVIESVLERTEPGPRRDAFLFRFFHSELLGMTMVAARDHELPEFLEWWHNGVAQAVSAYLNDEVYARLGVLERVILDLSRREDPAAFHSWSRFVGSTRASAYLDGFAWTPDGGIRMKVRGGYVYGDGQRPLTVVERDGRVLLDPAIAHAYGVPDVEVDLTEDLPRVDPDIRFRRREDRTQWSGRAEVAPVLTGSAEPHPLVFAGEASVALEAEGARERPGRGHWDLYLALDGLGVGREIRLGEHRAPGVDAQVRPALLGSPARPAIPYFTAPANGAPGNLSVDLGGASKRLAAYLAGRPVRRLAAPKDVLLLDLVSTPATAVLPVRLVLSGADGDAYADSRLYPVNGRVALPVPAGWTAPAGPARLAVRLDGHKRPALPLGEVRVSPRGRLDLGAFEVAEAALSGAELAALRSFARPAPLSRRIARRVLPKGLRTRVARLVKK